MDKGEIHSDDSIEVYSGDKPYLFISYSHTDRELVMKVLRRLQEEKFRFWYDKAMGGEGELNFEKVLKEKIEKCSCTVKKQVTENKK